MRLLLLNIQGKGPISGTLGNNSKLTSHINPEKWLVPNLEAQVLSLPNVLN